MHTPNQNDIVLVNDGIALYEEKLTDELSDIYDMYGCYTPYAWLDENQGVEFAQLSYVSLERSSENVPAKLLNAFAFGHIAAQLCTRYDGVILLSNQHDDASAPASPDHFCDILDIYLTKNYRAHCIAAAFLDVPLHSTEGVRDKPTEIYMASAAMLLADLSNMKMSEIDKLINSV